MLTLPLEMLAKHNLVILPRITERMVTERTTQKALPARWRGGGQHYLGHIGVMA